MKILSSIDDEKDIVNKKYIDDLEIYGFEIVNSLPTGTNIDPETIYLIEGGGSGGGGGGGSSVTYTLSESGGVITLTGSDSSSSSVNVLTSTDVQNLIDASIGAALEASY